jgi:hypothetical protein
MGIGALSLSPERSTTMPRYRATTGSALFATIFAFAGCDESPMGTSDFAEELATAGRGNGKVNNVSVCNPHKHKRDFTLEIDNPFFPMPVGRQWILEGEEDGEELRLQITVLDETEIVGGIETRVVEEREWEDGELVEVSRNFFAQIGDDGGKDAGTICYFGESEVPPAPGEWRADAPKSRPGIFMPTDPEIGMVFQQEDAPTARDRAGIVGKGETVTVPFGTFSSTLLAMDCNPLEEPGCDPLEDGDLKVYEEGLGIIVDAAVELVAFTP